jgi:hypothetical protein
MRHSRVVRRPEEERNWPSLGLSNALGRSKMKKTASTEAAGRRIDGGEDAKREIPVPNETERSGRIAKRGSKLGRFWRNATVPT